MSIVGVTLVLFLLGIIGWLVINANKIGYALKESVEVRAFLRGDLNPKDSTALYQYVAGQPYIKTVMYVDKDQAMKILIGDGNEDPSPILDGNPLPNSINFKVSEVYLNSDSLARIKTDLEAQTNITEVQYPKALIDDLNKNVRQISIVLLAIALILSLVVIFLIDNTIRLAMFSNRFLIKTMQMVGATRWFIARPMNIRAIINGAISGVIAIAAVVLVIVGTEKFIPEMKAIHDNQTLVLLFAGLIVLGIFITLLSTHRSVLKYLRMKLDDLY